MTRTRAMIWGAAYGGLFGPALGGLLFLLIASMLPGGVHVPILERIEYVLAGSLLGVLWFGAPGLLTGTLGAYLLHWLLQRVSNSRLAQVLPATIGVLAAFVSLLIFRIVAHMYVLNLLFIASASVAGAISFALFGRQLRTSY